MVKEKEDEVDSLGSWTQEEENELSHAMPQPTLQLHRDGGAVSWRYKSR